MGHRRSSTFAYYVQVQDDTQSAFMETPTRDALMKLATNSGLTRDASVPQELSHERKKELENDVELKNLKRKRDTLRAELIAVYHQLQKARGTDLYTKFQKTQNKIRSERKKLYTTAKDEQHESFFKNVGNQIIKRNYQGKTTTFEPDTSHVVPERKALADLKFKNRDVDKINDTELLEDRIQSLEMRLALHRLEVPKTLQKRIHFDKPSSDKACEGSIPLKSESGLECPVCLGCSDMHPKAKRYRYARKDTLQRHFKTHQLWQKFRNSRTCDYPGCETILHSLPQYEYHQNTAHNILL